MELREVIGTRRSYRFLDPDRPVEIEKIQRMLEAARIASHFGNNNAARALVVNRATATQEQLESLPSPVGGYQIQQAPIIILWYVHGPAMDEAADRLIELVDCGALGYGPDRFEELNNTLVPVFRMAADNLKAPGMVDMDLGQAVAQATLMAIEQGLGCCCQGSPELEESREGLWLRGTAAYRGGADRRLPGGIEGGRRTTPAPALRGSVPAQLARQRLPARCAGGRGD